MKCAPRPLTEVIRGNLDTLPRRFWAKVQKSDREDACWEWTAGTIRGYGTIDKALAHRISYWFATGVDPAGYFVMHLCDNPPCVRPAHLHLGTPQDNMTDAATKGRMPGRPTLSDTAVAQIRELWALGLTSDIIAARLGVSQQQAHRIATGRSRGGTPVVAPWMEGGWRTHPVQKLTDEQVREIRRRYAAGGITMRALGREYGINSGYVSDLVHRKERPAC